MEAVSTTGWAPVKIKSKFPKLRVISKEEFEELAELKNRMARVELKMIDIARIYNKSYQQILDFFNGYKRFPISLMNNISGICQVLETQPEKIKNGWFKTSVVDRTRYL